MTAKQYKESLHTGDESYDKDHHNFNERRILIDIGGETFALMLDYMYNQTCNW